MKKLLWHEPDLSLPPPPPCCIKVKPLVLASRIFLSLTTWLTRQCRLPWGTLALLSTCFMSVLELPSMGCALGSDLQTPAHSERTLPQAHLIETVVCRLCTELLLSLVLPFLWNNYGTLPKKSSIGTGSRKTKQQNDKLGTNEEQGTSRRCPEVLSPVS